MSPVSMALSPTGMVASSGLEAGVGRPLTGAVKPDQGLEEELFGQLLSIPSQLPNLLCLHVRFTDGPLV